MKFFYLIRAVLREIFDEAAYERFCEREAARVNRTSYAEFLRRREHLIKIRCC